MWKALDNNDLNQVWLTSGFVKTWVFWGCSVSQAHKTWSRPLLLETFRFEDENDYEYEILLEVFSRILKI